MTKLLAINPQTRNLWIIGAIALTLSFNAKSVKAASFSVDSNSVGLPMTALSNDPPPAPNDIFWTGLNIQLNIQQRTNFIDIRNADVGLPDLKPPNLNALSAGYDPIDAILPWDFKFSVDPNSVGVRNSSVNDRVKKGNAAASDIYWTGPMQAFTNRLWTKNTQLGLNNNNVPNKEDDNPGENLDAMETIDSRYEVERDYPSFKKGFNNQPDHIYFSANDNVLDNVGGVIGQKEDIFMSDGNGNISLFRDGINNIGLQQGDDIDALVLDIDVDVPAGKRTFQQIAMENDFDDDFNFDRKTEALFSLAPGSPTLNRFFPRIGRNLSPADILYTDFNGNFDIAGPTGLLGNHQNNLAWPPNLDLTFDTLGLLPDDNVDATELLWTMTDFANMPMIPANDIPIDGTAVPTVPEPTSILSILAIGTLGAASTLKRKLKPSKSPEKELEQVSLAN